MAGAGSCEERARLTARTSEASDGSTLCSIAPASAPEPFAAVAETTSGVVFFVGERAYKLKKPVALGFLDFTRLEDREAACLREVELNRRLNADVYLGVAEVRGPDGLREPLVVMRRLPASARLSSLVSAGAPTGEHLRRLAQMMATFHAGAERSGEIEATASRDATLRRWETNASRMGHLAGALFDPEMLDRVLLLARRYLAGREPLFAARMAAGDACDGHGDLLADDIFCLDDGPRVLDCLDFDDELRYGDVLADVAFLAMDLESLGRPDLAATFLDHYKSAGGATWPASLAHHHIAYRAQVRALVVGLRFEQGDSGAVSASRHLLRLAHQHLERGRVRLVVIGGLPGTGKSTLSAEVGRALGARVICADEVRKRLAGLEPTTPAPAAFGEGIYKPEMTAATYEELLGRARKHLSFGEAVVLDATFSDPKWREAARSIARETFTDLDELECVAPPEVIEDRISRRADEVGQISDAGAAVLRELARRGVPWPGAKQVDTSASTDVVRGVVAEVLGLAPDEPPGEPSGD